MLSGMEKKRQNSNRYYGLNGLDGQPKSSNERISECKKCAQTLITAKGMYEDKTVMTGACAQRTFTCKGFEATIKFSGVSR